MSSVYQPKRKELAKVKVVSTKFYNENRSKCKLIGTVTHEPRHKRRNNDIIVPNPNISDKKPMYVIKRQRTDVKDNFALRPLP